MAGTKIKVRKLAESKLILLLQFTKKNDTDTDTSSSEKVQTNLMDLTHRPSYGENSHIHRGPHIFQLAGQQALVVSQAYYKNSLRTAFIFFAMYSKTKIFNIKYQWSSTK